MNFILIKNVWCIKYLSYICSVESKQIKKYKYNNIIGPIAQLVRATDS